MCVESDNAHPGEILAPDDCLDDDVLISRAFVGLAIGTTKFTEAVEHDMHDDIVGVSARSKRRCLSTLDATLASWWVRSRR